MPRTRTTPPLVIKMGQEVFDCFLPEEKNLFSYEAFIFHFRQVVKNHRKEFLPESYTYGKDATQDEVKSLIRKHNRQSKTRKIRVPELQPKKRYKL